PVREEVLQGMMPFFCSQFGNPASRHSAGQEAWNALENAREKIAELAGAEPDDVIFTSGATESNFTALLGRFETLVQQGRNPESIHIAISSIEHPCVKACAER